MNNNKPNVLYLSYTGMLEPLGRSQVLAYLSRLSQDYDFTIISFEKADDFSDKAAVEELRQECEQLGINWQPKLYHKKPRLLATLYDMWLMFYTALKLNKTHKYSLVHGRSYVASGIALTLSKVIKVPFIFDMRALWVEELIAANSIKRGSLIEKLISYLEKKLLLSSSHIVSLTQAAIPFLQNKYPKLNETKFSVIPTCVDLNRFTFEEQANNTEINKVGTMGSVLSKRFRADVMFALFKNINHFDPNVNFKIVSKDNSDIILEQMALSGGGTLELGSCSPEQISKHIKDIDFAVVTFKAGVSTLGTSPTRIAELLACGIPVVVSESVGDTAKIIVENNVGIAINVDNPVDYQKLWLEMQNLKLDGDLQKRCRKVSEDVFSADAGAVEYAKVYKKILN